MRILREGFPAILLALLFPALIFMAIIMVGYDGKPYLRGDCSYYVAAARSIAEDGDLDIRNQLRQPLWIHSTQVALDQEGRFVPKHPLWMSVAVIPFLLLFGNVGALIFNFVQLLILCFLLFVLARCIVSPWEAAGAVCLTTSLSYLPHYVWNFSPDIFLSVLYLMSIVSIHDTRKPWRHILAGILLGLAMTAKPSYLLAGVALPLLSGLPLKKSLSFLAVGGVIPVMLWMGLNQHLFGAPLVSPYDRIAHFTERGVELHSNRQDFTEPLLKGVWGQFADPKKGLLQTSPITIFSFLFLPLLWRKEMRWALYTCITSCGIYLFYSKYALWRASHWGNRFLLPIVILGILPLATALEWRFSGHGRKQ